MLQRQISTGRQNTVTYLDLFSQFTCQNLDPDNHSLYQGNRLVFKNLQDKGSELSFLIRTSMTLYFFLICFEIELKTDLMKEFLFFMKSLLIFRFCFI